jgi:hypothetical protein
MTEATKIYQEINLKGIWQMVPVYRVITNDVSNYIHLLIRIVHITCNHSVLNFKTRRPMKDHSHYQEICTSKILGGSEHQTWLLIIWRLLVQISQYPPFYQFLSTAVNKNKIFTNNILIFCASFNLKTFLFRNVHNNLYATNFNAKP